MDEKQAEAYVDAIEHAVSFSTIEGRFILSTMERMHSKDMVILAQLLIILTLIVWLIFK